MADSLSSNLPKYHIIIHLLIVGAQFLTGIFINGFIVVVNAVDFSKHRRMAPLNLLISCLAISRACWQLIVFLLQLILLSFLKFSVLLGLNITLIFVNILCLWLATWLSVFYCAKIATIPNSLFFWLKMNISKLVPWLILGSALYAAVNTYILVNYIQIATENIMGQFLYSNETHIKRIDFTPLSILNFHVIVPLIIFLIAALLLIYSLGRHSLKMRTIATGTQYASCGAPLRAMLSILSFFILYLCYCITGIVFCAQEFEYGRFFILFLNLVCGSYPSIHSVIIIFGNPKLKENMKKFLFCGQ